MLLENIKNAIENKRVLVLKQLIPLPPSWNQFHKLFTLSDKDQKSFNFFGGMTIKGDQANIFDDVASVFETIHPGHKVSIMSIIHFVNRTQNFIPEPVEHFYKDFAKENPHKIPENFDLNLLQPSRHSDAADGFFLQCEGSTLWKIFYNEKKVDAIIVGPGDALFIPEGVEHSVESLCPRAAVSISFINQSGEGQN